MTVVVSALVMILETQADAVWDGLGRLTGVTPVPLQQETQVGIMVETESLEEAYDLIQEQIPQIEGVLRVRPVYAHFGSEGEDALPSDPSDNTPERSLVWKNFPAEIS